MLTKYSPGLRPMACQILHQLLLCRFCSLLVRAREAAPGTLGPQTVAPAWHSRDIRSAKITPGHPQGRFLKIWAPTLAEQNHQQTYWSKIIPNLSKLSQRAFGSAFDRFRPFCESPFGIDLHDLKKLLQSIKVFVFQYFCLLWGVQK